MYMSNDKNNLDLTADEMLGYVRGKRDERARIVAALRANNAKAMAELSPSDAREAEDCNLICAALADVADAIERGEL